MEKIIRVKKAVAKFNGMTDGAKDILRMKCKGLHLLAAEKKVRKSWKMKNEEG